MTDINILKSELGKIEDAGLGKTLAELDAIEINGNSSKIESIKISLPGPLHNNLEQLKNEIGSKIKGITGSDSIPLEFLELYPKRNLEVIPKVKNIIAVASGKGGVGKSSVASNLASALSLMNAKVGILDADVYGPSQPTMFGLKGIPLSAYQEEDGAVRAYPNEQFGIKVASMGFVMNRDDAAIVRGPMLAGYFSMLLEQVEWGELDYMIIDLPPGTGDIQLTMTQKVPLTGSVIITTPQEIALADVRRSITMFNRVNVDILGIIENMSWFEPHDMPGNKYYIFGKDGGKNVAEEFGIDLLGQIPLDAGLGKDSDSGKPHVFTGSGQADVINTIAKNMVRKTRQINYRKLSEIVPVIEL